MHFTEPGNLIEKHTIIFKVTKKKKPLPIKLIQVPSYHLEFFILHLLELFLKTYF